MICARRHPGEEPERCKNVVLFHYTNRILFFALMRFKNAEKKDNSPDSRRYLGGDRAISHARFTPDGR
jgi:hypothetical protein